MKRAAALVALAALLAVVPTSAPQAQTTRDNCTPQPECRLLSSKLQPGAPTTGMKAQGKAPPGNFEQKIFTDTSRSISRDSYRLPSLAK